MPRHGREDTFVNRNEFYEEFLEKRGLSRVKQYATPKLPPLTKKIRRKFVSQSRSACFEHSFVWLLVIPSQNPP